MKRKPSKGKDKRSIIYIAQPTFDEAKANMQKTFVIKPEKKTESESVEEKKIDAKEETINNWGEKDVKAEAKIIEEVKTEKVVAEAESIEEVKTEGIVAKAKAIKEVKVEEVTGEPGITREVKAESEFTKEQQTEDEQSETIGIVAKENKVLESPKLRQEKNDERDSAKAGRKRKPFKEMNNEEKLYYLIQQPKYIPKVRCQIKTVEEKLTGYILSYKEGYVGIKMMEKTKEVKVKFEDIVHIKMMGL